MVDVSDLINGTETKSAGLCEQIEAARPGRLRRVYDIDDQIDFKPRERLQMPSAEISRSNDGDSRRHAGQSR